MENKENAIEWMTGQRTITVSLSHLKYVNKVKALAVSHPKDVKILAVNDDGTILAKLPIKYLKLSAPRQVSEEQREQMRERFLARQNK
jgi:hypothetical protein